MRVLQPASGWGLNRAIFYAAAKRGFKGRGVKVAKHVGKEIEKRTVKKIGRTYFLGDEMAYASKKQGQIYFTIGGELQTESDFERQIENRFGANFSNAWKEAQKIVQEYPKETLLSQHRFFEDVYKPRRDDLASKWSPK